MRSIEILVLEHEREVPTALFGDWAEARGHTLRTVAAAELMMYTCPCESTATPVGEESSADVAAAPSPL